MLQEIAQSHAEVLKEQTTQPCISIIIPFEPKMSQETELKHALKIATDKVKANLLQVYEASAATAVIKKLQAVINDLNYNTHKKTLAIFVSPLIEKVYYLDIIVEEQIIIGESFEMRDLIYGKKQIHKYRLVVLNSKWTKIYLGKDNQLIKVISNVAGNIATSQNEPLEPTSNCAGKKRRSEVLLDKFLQHSDRGLTLLQEACRLPLFIMGTPHTIGRFKAITKNAKNVIEYIHLNFEDLAETELRKIMEPYVADWKKVMQTDLLNQLAEARDHHKLSAGIKQVLKAAAQKRGKLLIVEKNFMYPAVHGSAPNTILRHDEKTKNAFYIKDAVDDIIEKVLAGGGDIEFTEGLLPASYENIALIEFHEHTW